MSQRAYILAAVDYLHTLFGLTTSPTDTCDVCFDGQPKPVCGERFIAVWPGDWGNDAPLEGANVEERVGFMVTVTRRLGQYPKDRVGRELLLKASTGLEADCRKIIFGDSSLIKGLHLNYDVMNAANATYITSAFEGFEEPVRWVSASKAEPKGPDWFEAEGDQGFKGWLNVGLAQTLVFNHARRVQSTVTHPASEVS